MKKKTQQDKDYLEGYHNGRRYMILEVMHILDDIKQEIANEAKFIWVDDLKKAKMKILKLK